jgi:hypothetical protein
VPGVAQVFFNESWDHGMHIELSYYYFIAACLNNSFAFFALAPAVTAQYGVPWHSERTPSTVQSAATF